MKKNVKTIYQYLSIPAFTSMINYGTLKLSDIKKSNDTTELKLRFDVFDECIIDAYDKEKPKYMSKISTEDFMKILREKTNFIKETEYNIHTQYVSCFSEQSDLLSQWRGYSQKYTTRINKTELEKRLQEIADKNGDYTISLDSTDSTGGVSVGFSLDALQKLLLSDSNLKTVFSVDKVCYSKRLQKALMREAADQIVKQVRLFVKANKSLDGFDWNPIRICYHDALITKGAFIKNDFFFEEREWRVCMFDTTSANKKEILLAKPNTIISNEKYSEEYANAMKKYMEKIESLSDDSSEKVEYNMPSGYYFLYMGNKINELITEVVIGPKSKLTIENVKKMLNNKGINCNVTTSRGFDVFVDSINHKNQQ